MKSYGEPLVEKFILHLNMTRQELRRATESYGEQWEFDHSKAMESYRELCVKKFILNYSMTIQEL